MPVVGSLVARGISDIVARLMLVSERVGSIACAELWEVLVDAVALHESDCETRWFSAALEHRQVRGAEGMRS